jgi:hypothetical protein
MYVEVARGAEALYQGDRAAMAFVGLEPGRAGARVGPRRSLCGCARPSRATAPALAS